MAGRSKFHVLALALLCTHAAHAGFASAQASAQAPAPAPPRTEDDFAHAYDFAPDKPNADDFHPAETSGPALVLGLGSQLAGFGLQLGYYLVVKEQPFAFYGYASAGAIELTEGVWAGAGGMTALFGRKHRWALDASFGAIGTISFTLYDEKISVRPVYGFSLSAGREWMWSTHLLFRVLVGASYMTDPAPFDFADRIGIAFSIGLGWKPW